MIKTAIVDDDPVYAEYLKKCVSKYGAENKVSFDVTFYLDGDQIVQEYHSQFDLIFMNVEMKFLNGISAADEIRKRDTEVVILFITSQKKYAFDGYAVDALDYIMKPASYPIVAQALDRVVIYIKGRKKAIIIHSREGDIRINPVNIYYLESQGHRLLWHTAFGIYESSDTITEMEEFLNEENFCRGNRGYLINLRYVESMQDGCAIVKKEQLPISRLRRKSFMNALTDYWNIEEE